jgi:hypothetical protein
MAADRYAILYSSGEEIRKGDRALLHGEVGKIELIADPAEILTTGW